MQTSGARFSTDTTLGELFAELERGGLTLGLLNFPGGALVAWGTGAKAERLKEMAETAFPRLNAIEPDHVLQTPADEV